MDGPGPGQCRPQGGARSTAAVPLLGGHCYLPPGRGQDQVGYEPVGLELADPVVDQPAFQAHQGGAVAAERGITAGWKSPMPSHSLGVPKLADRIAEALYARISMGEIDRLDAVFSQWQPGHGIHVERSRLFPFDMSAFPRSTDANGPLLNLACETLLSELTADYMHAQLCNAALHAFAAENEARMEAMAAAHKQIERQLSSLQATQRLVRQEEITAEIIELAAGETASRSD